MSTKDLIRKRFDEARAELAALEASIAPVQAKLDAAAADLAAARSKWRKLGDDSLPALRKDEMRALAEEVSALAGALGGKRASNS